MDVVETPKHIHEEKEAKKKPLAKRKKEQTREARAKKREAVKFITKTYLQECEANKKYPVEINNLAWKAIANQYPEWSEQIQSLQMAITIARRLKNDYKGQEELLNMMHSLWNEVQDEMAKGLLTEILWARTPPKIRFEEYEECAKHEARMMKIELVSPRGVQQKLVETLTIEKVVKAVLDRKLQITSNPDYHGVYN